VLDNTRILVIQQLKAEWIEQIDFVQARLNNLQPRLPERISQQLQARINHTSNNWQDSHAEIETLHQEISALKSQTEQI
jgi:chromosome segregation ATPase